MMGVALVGTLIFTSGGTSSPFISAWLAVALFAGFFGGIVAIIMLLMAIAQVFISTDTQTMELPMIVGNLVFGLAPIFLGFVIWHRQPSAKKTDNSFRDLANKLSTVEGKSDVVINSIDDGVVSINRSGIIDLINPSAERLLGWNQGDALGLDWRSVFKLANQEGREIPEAENPVAQSLLDNSPIHDDTLQIITSSDKKRLVSIVSSPVGQGEGGIIVVFRDITKEKAEEREQAEFISTASHEMRTPVASIEGYLGLALNPATAQIDDKARDFITKAHQSAKHLGELFQNLLDISRAEDGRLKSNPEVIDVIAMTGDVFESLTPLANEKNLRYIFKPNPSLETDSSDRQLRPVFYSHIDPAHLREVISNLIENAIKYTPAGDVTVDINGDEKIVTISIQDSGIGIPTEDIPHLFQKFYRVDNTDTREIGGTGLGLYLCRRLAEAMGGGIRVESTYKKGSTFSLDIPRISHEEAMEKISQSTEELTEIVPLNPERTMAQAPPAEMEPLQPQLQPVTPPTPIPVQYIPPAPQPEPPIGPPDPSPLEVTQTSGSSLEFKIPEQFQNLPFQDMTLADIEMAVLKQPVYEDSGLQPLNILPDQEPATPPQPRTTPPVYAETPQPQPVQPPSQPSPAPRPIIQPARQQIVGIPPRQNP